MSGQPGSPSWKDAAPTEVARPVGAAHLRGVALNGGMQSAIADLIIRSFLQCVWAGFRSGLKTDSEGGPPPFGDFFRS